MNSTLTQAEQLDELLRAKAIIENPIFQEYIVKPMREYQGKQGKAYDCETLKELYRTKGRHDGAEELFKILKRIDVDCKNLIHEIQSNEKES